MVPLVVLQNQYGKKKKIERNKKECIIPSKDINKNITMDESALTTLLEHVLERLTNIEVKQDEMYKDIKRIDQRYKKQEIMSLIEQNEKIKVYDIFEKYVKNDIDYFFTIGQIRSDINEEIDLIYLDKCIAYIFMKTMKTEWKKIDYQLRDGYNSISKFKADSSYDFWNFDEIDKEAYEESLQDGSPMKYDKKLMDFPTMEMVETMFKYHYDMTRSQLHSF